MASDRDDWKPALDEEALKALIRETVAKAGPIDPGALPSKVRERIKGRATGKLDIEGYIRDVLNERARKG